jgi:hypothetical protein
VAAGGGDHQGALGVVLALDVDEVLLVMRQAPEDPLDVDRLGLDVEPAGEEPDGLGEAADGVDGLRGAECQSWTRADKNRHKTLNILS